MAGGKRKGAGRPSGTTLPDGKAKIQVAARICPELAEWLRSHKKYSTIIEKALKDYKKKIENS